MTRQTRPRVMTLMTLIHLMTFITDIDDARIRIIWKKDLIRLCATLTPKLLTTSFKSEMIRFKLDEDPLQRRIYFLTFIDSLSMVVSQYRETYEGLRDYPKMEGGNVKDYAKQAIRNLLHANSCVHSRRLIAEFPEYGIKCMEKCSHIVQI